MLSVAEGGAVALRREGHRGELGVARLGRGQRAIAARGSAERT